MAVPSGPPEHLPPHPPQEGLQSGDVTFLGPSASVLSTGLVPPARPECGRGARADFGLALALDPGTSGKGPELPCLLVCSSQLARTGGFCGT